MFGGLVSFTCTTTCWATLRLHTGQVLTEVTDEDGEVVGRARYVPTGMLRKRVWRGFEQHHSIERHRTLTRWRLACPTLRVGCCANTSAGLVYAGDGRWYDPVLGVYLQPDPFGGAPEAPESLNRYAAGVSTFPTLGNVPSSASSSRSFQRHTTSLTTDAGFLAGTLWWAQQTVGQAAGVLFGHLAQYSLVHFTVQASRHKLLTRLPPTAISLLGGRGVIQGLAANRQTHTLKTGWHFTRRSASRQAFNKFTRTIAGDGRSTRWAGTVDDYFNRSLSWMGSRWFGLASAGVLDVLVQWGWPGSGDLWKYEEYGLTPRQFVGRGAVAFGGGMLAFGAVGLAGYAAVTFGVLSTGASLPLAAGIIIAVAVEAAYEGLVKPTLYEWFDLYGTNEPR